MGTDTDQTGAERRLINAARRGDLAAFNRLLRAHEQTAYCVAWWLTGGQAAALEATDRAVLKAYKAMGGYSGASFRAWLVGQVLSVCHEPRPRARGAPPSAGAPPTHLAPPAEEPALRDHPSMRAVVAAALRDLPEEQRAVLILRDIAGLDYGEIAEATGQSAWQASCCLAHARAGLAARLRGRNLARAVSG